MYSVAIQVKDRVTETEGVFGPAESFATIAGVPSPPTALEARWVTARRELSLTWGVPNVTNGTIRRYELVYSDGRTRDCDRLRDDANNAKTVTLASSARSYATMNTSAIVDNKSFFVCVRGHTDQAGEWATFFEPNVVINAVTGTTDEENCNGLIAVAVVAGVAVVSTVIAAVILFIVVRYHNNQVADRHKSDGHSSTSSDQMGLGGSGARFDRNSPSRGSTDTGFDEQQQQTRPPFQTQDSIASTNTLRPLLSNGKT